MNDDEFRARLRKKLGRQYGRAFDLFKSFGQKFSDSIADILSKTRSRGEAKRTIELLERIENNLLVVMDTPRRPEQRLAELQQVDRFLGNLAAEVDHGSTRPNQKRERHTTFSHDGHASSEPEILDS